MEAPFSPPQLGKAKTPLLIEGQHLLLVLINRVDQAFSVHGLHTTNAKITDRLTIYFLLSFQ
jgi:hypothetical protein